MGLTMTNTNLTNLTAFQRDVLWVLADESGLNGVKVRRQLENYYEKPVNHGQVYSNLDHLVETGLVEKSKVDGRTNAYNLTETGRRALSARQAWIGGVADE